MVGVVGWIVVVLACFMVVTSIVHYRHRKVPLSWALFWSGIWIAGTFVVVFSGTAEVLSQRLVGLQANIATLYLSVLLLFFLMFRLYVRQQRTRQELSELVETIAKDNPRKKHI